MSTSVGALRFLFALAVVSGGVGFLGVAGCSAYSGCTQNGFFDDNPDPAVACSLNYSCNSSEVDLRLSCAPPGADGNHACACFDNGVEVGSFEDSAICDDREAAKARFEAGCGIQIYESLGIFTVARAAS